MGWRQCDIAIAMNATKGAVSQWVAIARDRGVSALHSHPSPGCPSKLTPMQKSLISDFLWHGAEAYGFRGERWTCTRVAKVLMRELGVSYSRSQVSRILKELGWTPQIPITRAIQRDEAAIEQWRIEVWPLLKAQAKREHRTLVFVDEAGFYLLPGLVKTYAPAGKTPLLKEWQTRDHLSVMGGITMEGKVYTLVRQESLNGSHTVTFLAHALHVVGDRLLLIWDNSPIHRCKEVKKFLADVGSAHIHLERLPAYAPDLNPIEWAWHHLKQVEMANLACLDLEELHMEFHLAVGRLRKKTYLGKSFFAGAELPL